MIWGKLTNIAILLSKLNQEKFGGSVLCHFESTASAQILIKRIRKELTNKRKDNDDPRIKEKIMTTQKVPTP